MGTARSIHAAALATAVDTEPRNQPADSVRTDARRQAMKRVADSDVSISPQGNQASPTRPLRTGQPLATSTLDRPCARLRAIASGIRRPQLRQFKFRALAEWFPRRHHIDRRRDSRDLRGTGEGLLVLAVNPIDVAGPWGNRVCVVAIDLLIGPRTNVELSARCSGMHGRICGLVHIIGALHQRIDLGWITHERRWPEGHRTQAVQVGVQASARVDRALLAYDSRMAVGPYQSGVSIKVSLPPPLALQKYCVTPLTTILSSKSNSVT